MYHVIGTGSTAILLYIISYFFYRIGYYSSQFHLKLWNSLLAIAFIVTFIAGLFMALQVTYKWNIPFVKSVLKWHVEFGIGMSITGIFHLIWHFSYFTQIFTKSDRIGKNGKHENITSKDISTNLFILGFVSSSIQLLLIREMMNIAGGYELITGTFLGSWLIGSAIGSTFAGKSTLNDVKKINLIFSLAPLISLLLLLFLSRLFLNTGQTPSFLISVLYTLIVLIPFCIVSGFTFIKLIATARSVNNFIPGKSFSLETTGGIVAGISISFLTSGFLNTYQLLLLIVLLSIAYVLLTFYIRGFNIKISVKILIALLATCIIILKPDVVFRQLIFPGIKVIGSTDTPYGNITTGKYKGEESIYYNQRLLTYKDDVVEREEDVHYAMLQSDSPEKVMLISGQLRSHLAEIQKYPVKKIIYLERDPALIKLIRTSSDSLPSELTIENHDAIRYIKSTVELFDIVMVLIPPPSTLLLNRYYTIDFFSEVKKKLNKGGIFMCSPGSGEDYFNKESLNLYSSIFNSLLAVFKNVTPIVGNKLYFIASDKELSASICHLAELKNISNTYVSSDFLADDLILNKSNALLSLLDRGIRQNSSEFPVACFHFQSYNFSKNLAEKTPAFALLIILFAVPVLTIRRRNLFMYFSASALAGCEIIILLSLQLVIGNMYQLTGLMIAAMMAGLAVGAGTKSLFLESLSLRTKSIILILFYIVTGLVYNYFLALTSVITAICLLVISSFLPAIITGSVFRELTSISDNQETSSATYSADLTGSAFGFILIAGFTVPAFGIKISILILSSLILAGLLFGTVRNK
jgi:predicted membrane-bound spermidine synthase